MKVAPAQKGGDLQGFRHPYRDSNPGFRTEKLATQTAARRRTHRVGDRFDRPWAGCSPYLLPMAGALLIGLLGDALVGAWWLDPLVGLLIAALAIHEGLEAWEGDTCAH
jgi:hypothetical protein